MDKIGVIGLGRMGAAIAERLAGQGGTVCGWTRSGRAVEGVPFAETLADLVAQSTVLVLSLYDDAAVGEVLDALLALPLEGRLIIDTSTANPQVLQARAAALAAKGARAVDAPISGGPELVRAGNCGIFIGGTEADAEAARAVLTPLSARIFHTGPLGAGLVMKVINNGMLQAYWAGLADMMPLARRAGLPLETVLNILAGGPAGMPALRDRLPKVLGEDEAVGFPARGVFKDNALFRAIVQAHGLTAPTLERLAAEQEAATETGVIDQDLARLIWLAYDRGAENLSQP
ncbi:3-hydroxyisobutyrate dehydrogenase [Rhodobacter aestuarii]|uniref:3-hydroxyisobutyrate dehydrogenase n=2 Tax=Rhodobacter aestuarii TaxID=453582 RepID=A0A1N7P4X2_9RHOB|nr:3-hydroxyisobutyrate dehydrogenase [Rhodobacter aestuarii]SIT05590.1 3-hydroxyisobutyrate dehydrogenase [Rhodobacter aestuarii]